MDYYQNARLTIHMREQLASASFRVSAKTVANCTAIESAGKQSGSSPGCATSAVSLPDGNTTSKTSSALYTSRACTWCSDIYETVSRFCWLAPIRLVLSFGTPHAPLYSLWLLRSNR